MPLGQPPGLLPNSSRRLGRNRGRVASSLAFRHVISGSLSLASPQSHTGEHTPIIDQPLWDAVQAQLAANTAERNSGLRITAGEIEQAVTSRMRQWLVDPGRVYQAMRLADPSAQRRLITRAGEIGKSWPDLPAARQRTFLSALIERIDVRANRIDIHLRPTRLRMLLDIAATPLPSATDDETQILSVPIELRRPGREIKMLIEGTDPFAIAKPDARLIKLLIRARRFNATLAGSDGVPFAALAKREGVSPSYFTRLVRLSFLASTAAYGVDPNFLI